MGGGVTRTPSAQTSRNLTISAGDVPYNYAPLTSNLYISSDLLFDNRTVVTNMAFYAENYIPNYSTITSIPDEYSPNSINTSLANNWIYAFGGDFIFNSGRNLINLPDPFYDTSNATNMYRMFSHCGNRITIPNFNTSKVTNMSGMFYGSGLISISNFDTSNVTDMSEMFIYCGSITTVPNFDTGNVTNMYCMFDCCYNLTTVPNFNTSNVTNMSDMFCNCKNLTTVPNFNTSNVINMHNMFFWCYNLITIPNFNTSKVTDMKRMFNDCTKLITVPNFDTSNVTDMTFMFEGCYNLTTIPIFNITRETNMHYMFDSCRNIKGNLYIESNNISIDNCRYIFINSPNYTKNIYCHANTTTYNSIYSAMGNTYNSYWNTYLKTFENDPIGSISQIDSIQIDSIPDGGIYQNTAIFRSPVNTCAVYIPSPDNKILFTGPNFKLDPYTDYNFKVEFTAPTTSPTDPVDPESLALLTPMNLQIYAVSNTSNICIANTSGIFLPSGMNTIDIYINGYYPKTGDPEPNINICNIN